ncbi:acyltransferase [Aliikangiella coralliicola]|uniref:Acyltransferase n=1 Tax=Aliikangiella coralliicola TaxID=2592383 RepID=A0A545UG23_9GAMM|nr:acyltransferase [Aliikangiella coralliicola]TQV88426.1 acyltransferase [Aliikangiella coralliicola]
MLARILPAPLVGALSLFFHTINTFFWFVPILVVAILKLLVPIKAMAVVFNYLLNFFASSWISVNTVINKLSKPIEWEVHLPDGLSTNDWYLVIANHQSWVDILALQQTFNRKIPFLKFFLKQELFWVPVLGIAWWALDFPFMKRYSKSYIKKNPHKKGKDFETTKKACEKFKSIPISIMNFAEGTRFTPLKHQKQSSPYQNLLKPKTGGIGYVLTLMGNEINKVLNITITYPKNDNFSFWDFLCGRVRKIKLEAELIEIPAEVKGNYIEDPNIRRNVQQWVNQIWTDKDAKLSLNKVN